MIKREKRKNVIHLIQFLKFSTNHVHEAGQKRSIRLQKVYITNATEYTYRRPIRIDVQFIGKSG